jgi:hypothetical protein
MLTPKEKRQKLISEANILYMRDQPEWFKEVSLKISKLVEGKDIETRTQIILKWVRECENQASPTIKEEILKTFMP